MPEPGIGGSRGRSGSGMGAGTGRDEDHVDDKDIVGIGYDLGAILDKVAKPGSIDWGLGPEGHRTTVGGRRSGEDRDFGDDVSLQQKTAFMQKNPPASRPTSKPSAITALKSNLAKKGYKAKPTPLQNKQAFMSSNPFGHPSSFTTKSPDQPTNSPMSWSDIAKTDMESLKQGPRIGQSTLTNISPQTSLTGMQTGLNFQNNPTPPWMATEQFSPSQIGSVSDTERILSRFTDNGTLELTEEVLRALTMGRRRGSDVKNFADMKISDQLIRNLSNELGANVGAYFDPNKDKMVFKSDFTEGDVVHELGHRDIMNALRAGATWNRTSEGGQLVERALPTSVLDRIQMPDVQALYETDSWRPSASVPLSSIMEAQGLPFLSTQDIDVQKNPMDFSAGYGTQGEMVTSRAATARNLYDAQSQFYGGGEDWVDTVLNAPSEHRRSRPLSHPAIKAGWSGNTALDPNTNVTAMTSTVSPPFQDPAWEDDTNYIPHMEPRAYLPGINVAHPTHSVPGSGNVAAGYQAFLNKQQELPNTFVGGQYTPSDWSTLYGDPMQAAGTSLPTYTGIIRTPEGLNNHPLKQQHGLIQEFILRNKGLLGDKSKDVEQAQKNKEAALNAPASSMINKMQRHKLDSQFWDKLNSFYSTGWNPWYTPSQGEETIHKIMNKYRKVEGGG